MRTKKEIKARKKEDTKFLISAITSELHNMACLHYFDTWENEGGMQWFFDECVDITHEVMFKGKTKYKQFLKVWKKDNTEYGVTFYDVVNEPIDWYHMTKARELFKSRYAKDEDTTEEVSEFIGGLLRGLSDEDKGKLIVRAIEFAKIH